MSSCFGNVPTAMTPRNILFNAVTAVAFLSSVKFSAKASSAFDGGRREICVSSRIISSEEQHETRRRGKFGRNDALGRDGSFEKQLSTQLEIPGQIALRRTLARCSQRRRISNLFVGGNTKSAFAFRSSVSHSSSGRIDSVASHGQPSQRGCQGAAVSSYFCPRTPLTNNFQPSKRAPSSSLTQVWRSQLTRRNLFALNLNDGNKNDDDDDKKKGKGLPAWVRAVKEWPLYPALSKMASSPPPTVEEEKQALSKAASVSSTDTAAKDSDGEGGIPIPLANLINVEALLMANGEEVIDIVPDLRYLTGPSTKRRGKQRAPVAESESDKDSPIAAPSSLSSPADSTDAAPSRSVSSTAQQPLDVLRSFEELGDWNRLVGNLRRSLTGFGDIAAAAAAAAVGATVDRDEKQNIDWAESVLTEATSRVEDFLSETSAAISPQAVQDLIVRASKVLSLEEGAGGIKMVAATAIVEAAEALARDEGLDVDETANRARATTAYTANLVRVASGLLVSGYVAGDGEGNATLRAELDLDREATSPALQPLFDNFKTARAIPNTEYVRSITKAAELATLSGAIYEDTVRQTHELGHTIVANGTSADVRWLVTDSIGYEDEFRDTQKSESMAINGAKQQQAKREPVLVRTITIRGYDASDEDVDREDLLNTVCTATPTLLFEDKGIYVHSGLLSIARQLYQDLMQVIDDTAPTHKIVLNGHSIGGSLSTLVLMLLVNDRGADFVRERIMRVYTFGSPPVSTMKADENNDTPLFTSAQNPLDALLGNTPSFDDEIFSCSKLEALGLPASIVYGYIQPWDPIVRLFTTVDPLYPLLDDLGEDGYTPYASGPTRTFRPIAKTIFENWEGYPAFRDVFRETVNQNYTSVGVQHILLPEPIRYLSDRLVAINTQVPPVDTVIQISSGELLPSLVETFPLDVFSISFVPAALRSFIHHFYPAYGLPFVEYANEVQGGMENEERVAKEIYEHSQPTDIEFEETSSGTRAELETSSSNGLSGPKVEVEINGT